MSRRIAVVPPAVSSPVPPTLPTVSPGAGEAQLKRILTFWPLVLYGMGVIIGAGIYVSLDAVIDRAGAAAPISFIMAGIAAGFTGLCYAELAARYPQAAGAAAYVREGFASDRMGILVGVATTFAVAIAAAAIAHGAAGYLVHFVPVRPALLATIVILAFTGVAIAGVAASVGFAALMGLAEVIGLLAAIVVGLTASTQLQDPGIWPTSIAAWRGTAAGAFIAFFAFIGFETLANMAEETRNPRTTVPLSILAAIFASTVLYVGVALAVVLTGPDAANPLLGLFSGRRATLFAAIAVAGVSNGVLVEIVMLSRLFYGMATKGLLPRRLAIVDRRLHTPVAATLCASAVIVAAALLLPFERLLVIANAATLGIFLMVDISLALVRRREPAAPSFAAPKWAPYLAALLSAALLLAEALS